MNRIEVEQQFTADKHGLIVELGKFQRERLYVPYFWFAGLEGCSSEDEGQVQGFTLDAEDLQQWPELVADGFKIGDTLWLQESDQGFVSIITEDEAKECRDASAEDDSE